MKTLLLLLSLLAGALFTTTVAAAEFAPHGAVRLETYFIPYETRWMAADFQLEAGYTYYTEQSGDTVTWYDTGSVYEATYDEVWTRRVNCYVNGFSYGPQFYRIRKEPTMPLALPAPPPPPVVTPLRVTDDGLTAHGQRQRTCLYQLDRGRFYELQTSADGGATWSHRYVSCNQPEPLIQPGAGNIGNCGGEWWFITDTTSGPGYVLARFVDWTAANPRPGPFWKQ